MAVALQASHLDAGPGRSRGTDFSWMQRLPEPHWYDSPWAWGLITLAEVVVAGALAGAIVQALEFDRRP